MNILVKQCQTCKQELPVTNFCKNGRSKDGYNYHCKSCVKAYQLSIKDKLKVYQREYQKQYKAEHKEELYAYTAEWQKNNREKVRAYVKKSNAKRGDKFRAYMKEWRLRKKLEKQNDK